MGREKGDRWSSASFASTSESVKKDAGHATRHAEERAQQGHGVDPLVDPKSHGGMREANTLLLPQEDGTFLMPFGVALPIATEFDTTASFGENINKAFAALPRTQELVSLNPNAPLRNRPYHPQFAHAIMQDVCDPYAYLRTEFEPDNEIERQLRLMVPARNGGDWTEDYQLSFYALGYRTRSSITRYGLKGYSFFIADAIGREYLNNRDVVRVFGEEAAIQGDISVKELGRKVLESWHPFFFQVGKESVTTEYWSDVFGRERVVFLPHVENVPEFQAVIIGLTEGTLDLQSAPEFLMSVAYLDSKEAEKIVRAVSNIPLRAQANLLNFGMMPKPGSIFASRDDLWPTKEDDESLSGESQFEEEMEQL